MKTAFRYLAAALSLSFAGWMIGAAPATAAELSTAATCTHPSWSNKDPGEDSLKGLYPEVPVRTGPNAGCPKVGTALGYYRIYLHCYTFNSAGHSWSHVRAHNDFTGEDLSGWVYDEHLTDRGSKIAC